MSDFNLIVIGGGSAGSSCAEKCNKAGLKVALIERDGLGGTCLNYGCDPTKAALHAAKILHVAQQSDQYGLTIPEADLEWWSLQAYVRDIQEKVRGATKNEARRQMRERGIELLIGEASFVSPHEVKVNGRVLTADHILIATGTEAAVPPVLGLAQTSYVTNKTIFDMPTRPASLAIIGGGPIGVEFAQLFARLGTQVYVYEADSQILPKDDPELAAELSRILQSEGIEIQTQAELTAVIATPKGQQLTIRYESGYEDKLEVSELLIAFGRKTAVSALNLDVAGVKMQDGRIQTDETLATSIGHIWAAGDVTANHPFTHVAWRQGVHVAKNIINGQSQPFSLGPIPWVTYTDPELAHVGQTTIELENAGIPFRELALPMEDVTRATLTGQTDGRIKLLVGEGDLILGGHILAANGGELLGPIILAMQANVPLTALADTVWPYPTLSAGLGKAAAQ